MKDCWFLSHSVMTGLDAFVGSWQEQSKEGFDEMASALGKLNITFIYKRKTK